MNDAARAEAGTPEAMPSPPAAASHRVHRGRLFRKYLLLILTLVTIALLASGGISLYFTYQETKASLASLQHEKAIAAASRIEQYVHQIEQQLAYAALPQLDPSDVELRRIEFLKLLRQAPEVTDVAQIDASGRERIAVSRLGMDSIGSGKDRSQEAAFGEAKAGHPWYGPVYFRKETEPYMTIALRSGTGAVTAADVNLKFIWDVVSRIRIGDNGKAYVVDDKGYLVADPDIGLVLRKTNLSTLPHVRAAASAPRNDAEPAMVSTNAAGTRVLTSVAPIESLKWNVFVEQPVSEVYAKLNASILRTALLLFAGLGLSALGALALARGMVRPIRTLEEGAQRIGAGDLDQKIDIRTGDELEALAGQFNRMSGALRESYASLEQKVEVRTHELSNALEQQTAISEILRVISSSPTDVQPVLQAVAESAAHLCHAPYARVMVIDGDLLHSMAEYPAGPEFSGHPVPLGRTSVTGRAVVERVTVHIADVVPIAEAEFPDARENFARLGCRAVLAVPLLREQGAYGGIFLYRREPGLFTADQVALVQTFARQAAIAIDNVRLFNETKEALEQQTAVAEILRIISGTPGDVRPMLRAVAERALTLCEAAEAGIFLVEGDLLRFATGVGTMSIPAENETFPLNRRLVVGRAALDRRTYHYADVLPFIDSEYPDARATQARYGFRALLAVPLLREDRAIGAIGLWRREPRGFSDAQVALIRTFADQAAIAIENVRLFNETKEALEKQTAISEILRVISSSPTDVQPVFEIIGERSLKLCDAEISVVSRVDGDVARLATVKGMTEEGRAEIGKLYPLSLDANTVTTRAMRERAVVEVEDVLADPTYFARNAATVAGFRGSLCVPMIREGEVIGTIYVAHREPGRFSHSQIDLLKTFADQAVIAIENVRLLNETKEALERQTAMSEILRVISGSPTDVQPVFDTIAASALGLCDAVSALVFTYEDGLIHLAANANVNSEDEQIWRQAFPRPPSRDTAAARAILTADVVMIPDVLEDPEYKVITTAISTGFRSCMSVPLMRDGRPIGAIGVGRPQPGPFGQQEIAILQTFADQAVIAIENVRLFNETKEALERQTATADVLKVISGSPTNLQPVFHSIAERAAVLSSARYVYVTTFDGELIHMGAAYGPGAEAHGKHYPMKPSMGTVAGRVVLGRTSIEIPDMLADPLYEQKESAASIGFRGALGVPMVREGHIVGCIVVARAEAGRFAVKLVDLLKTFADQAVIAIENARLFNETKEALEQQTAVAEILRVISSSPTDVQPVLDAIAERASRLCDASAASIYLLDGNALRHLASRGPSPDPVNHVETLSIDRNSVSGRAFLERRAIQVNDMLAEGAEFPASLALARRFDHRAVLVIPLMREGQPFGTILLRRREVRPFGEHERALLQTFGDQAAIALENVRLFNEIGDKSRQLEIANRHKSEFLANMSHELRTPLNAIIGFSEVLLERLFGELNEKQDDYLKDIHSSGKHLLSLINDILDLSKIEAGRMELEPSSVDAGSAISNALTLIRERAQSHGIKLGQHVDADLGTLVVDERKFKQILLNLLSNAVKFTPDGGEIEVTARRADGMAEIAVRDTGIGIAPEDQAAVFEEFRQVGRDYTKKQEGTGLGLALARRFVELHGGRIRLASTPGRGSTFTFTIPLPS